MARAHWNNTTLADTDNTVVVENNHYFASQAVDRSYLRPSATRTTCPRKGIAHHYDVAVDGQVNKDAAWYYPEPKPAANEIKDRIAFWRGVKVEA